MTSTFVEMLGDTLVSNDGTTVATADALSGKVAVALYFSAHWCPPCRGFTPQFAKAYTDALKAKGMEVVFISSDRSQEDFDGYHKEQPWLALPYAERSKKNAVSKKFKIQGIPSLVILDGATGETITTNGREKISSDPGGTDFPWRPPSIWECLGSEFLQGMEGETVDVDEIKGAGKYIGLYFSAHWCPPCRQFTPELIKAYKQDLKAKNLEIIFVSSDRDDKSFKEYYETMPWLAIPNGDKRKGMLSSHFGVEGIPSFAIIDAATGETINDNARGKVSGDPTGLEFPWYPKALADINADGPDGINETTSLIVLLEECDEATTAAAKAALEPIAEAAKAAKQDMCFFFAPTKGGVTEQVRKLTKLDETPSAAPKMVLLDIPDEGGFYVSPATEVTTETINGFLEAYKAKALERKQLG